MAEIFFKATRRQSQSAEDYRQIVKRGDLGYDQSRDSDDVIHLYVEANGKTLRIGIDCNKKTGEFRLFFGGDFVEHG